MHHELSATSGLDFYSSLLTGRPEASLNSLQPIQRAAAWILMRMRNNCPTIASPHWFPVTFRTELNILPTASSSHFMFGMQTKLSFLIKFLVANSLEDLKLPFSDAATGLNCSGTSHDATALTSLCPLVFFYEYVIIIVIIHLLCLIGRHPWTNITESFFLLAIISEINKKYFIWI